MYRCNWRVGLAFWMSLCLVPLTGWGQGTTTLSGFVDTSFFYENLRDTNTFSLDEVELDIDSALTPWAGLRFDINFRASDSGDEIQVGIFAEFTTDEVLEQGYISLMLPTRKIGLPFDTTFRFGKFNAPIGWELLDPVDTYQFSHALVFNFGIPTNVTSALFALTFSEAVDVQFYIVNGWDNLNDNNKMKTFGGRLGLTPVKGINWGLAIITGPEQDDNEDDYRTVFDTDLTVEIIPALLIGAEFNYGMEENAALGWRNGPVDRWPVDAPLRFHRHRRVDLPARRV